MNKILITVIALMAFSVNVQAAEGHGDRKAEIKKVEQEIHRTVAKIEADKKAHDKVALRMDRHRLHKEERHLNRLLGKHHHHHHHKVVAPTTNTP
jgi:hypothetical protein